MKVFFLAFCCVFVAQANVLQTREAGLWENFKKTHKRVYKTEEEHDMRMKVFVENLKKIEAHNKRFEEGKETFDMKVNKFADMLFTEFAEKMLKRKGEFKQDKSLERTAAPTAAAPDAIDWREEGAVSPVQDQGDCGGCWSFAATGALESQTFLKTGKMVLLSQQNLIDCAKDDDHENEGCDGGFEYNGWAYVIENGGINTLESYPYEEKDGECRYDPAHIGATCTGIVHVPRYDEEVLKQVKGTVGPIAIGIDAEEKLMFYKSGVLKDDDCDDDLDESNHSVLAVGYGTENGEDYWLLKNSWGTDYGLDGYFKLARNCDNMCGVASDASYPTV